MKKSFLLSSKARMTFMAVFSSAMILLASCSKNSDYVPDPIGELDIRAVNTVIGSSNQDMLVNGAVKVSALAYGNSSAYVKMNSGVSSIGFYNTGTTTSPNAGGQVGLPIGAKASVYYYKKGDGTLNASIYDDAAAAPATGKAKVRFINLNNFLSSVNTISIAVDGASSAIIPSLEYSKISSYFEVEAGAKFKFGASGVTDVPVFDGPIVANKIYTIWIDGTSSANLTGHLVLQN